MQLSISKFIFNKKTKLDAFIIIRVILNRLSKEKINKYPSVIVCSDYKGIPVASTSTSIPRSKGGTINIASVNFIQTNGNELLFFKSSINKQRNFQSRIIYFTSNRIFC